MVSRGIFNMKIRICTVRPLMKFPIFAWAIMIFQKMLPWKKDSYSHFCLIYESETGRNKCIDSTSKGVRDRTSAQFFQEYKMVNFKTFEVDTNRQEFLEWFEEIEGRGYDSLQILGLALKVLGFVSYNRLGKNYSSLICNEVVLSFFERFYNVQVGDPDNYDLKMTWELTETI